METLKQEVLVPLKINTRKGRRACIIRPEENYAVTPLSKMLAKAYILQKRLKENPGISQKEFCELNNISPRYLRNILHFNSLSPTLKQRIMNGWMPKNISLEQIKSEKIPLSWKEQEEWLI